MDTQSLSFFIVFHSYSRFLFLSLLSFTQSLPPPPPSLSRFQPLFTTEYKTMKHPTLRWFTCCSGYHLRFTRSRSSVRSRAETKTIDFGRILLSVSSWNSCWCCSDLDCSIHVRGWPSERHPNVWRHRDVRGCLLLLNDHKIGRMPYFFCILLLSTAASTI